MLTHLPFGKQLLVQLFGRAIQVSYLLAESFQDCGLSGTRAANRSCSQINDRRLLWDSRPGNGALHGDVPKTRRVNNWGMRKSAGVEARVVAGVSKEYVIYLRPFSLVSVEGAGLSARFAPGVNSIQPGRLNNGLDNRVVFLTPVYRPRARSYVRM